ncbi:putative Histidyl-tRNA synthetase [Carnobacterium maltaromaticum]|uniref:ATP phosphoribosyltransferase regulatory subunit n=1 Tax=Carnobacterium maltaromaticum TaxID=2751 RepID=UPI00191BA014|nr:ATP phosphoribosyltransferase regulatory subunit [Carnobacterium maltaromaticum]CAD5897340.1 putative Histidyl-tRNA synthetase [Carnobacterium maltaromaticum]
MNRTYIDNIKEHSFFSRFPEIDHDELLTYKGLDSIETIDLILFLEDRFNISIPMEDITFDRFSTLKKISAYIESIVTEEELSKKNKILKHNKPIHGMSERYGISLEKSDYVTRIMMDTVKLLGYNQLEVPILEWAESFSEEVVGKSPWPEWNNKGMFYLNIDNYNDSYELGESSITQALLIPEGTISVTRWLGKYLDETNNLDFPIKIFYELACFRNELINSLSDTKKRQFNQFGIEILGSSSILADVENAYIVAKILQNLGINKEFIRIRTNNIKIFNQLISESLISEDDTIVIKEILDTLAECKAGKKKERFPNEQKRLEDILDSYKLSANLHKKWSAIINHFSGTISKDLYTIFGNDYKELFDELNEIQHEFKIHNLNFVIDLSVIRSHEYYTGFSFEVDVITGDKQYIEIAGGGRYDKLVGNFVHSSQYSKVPSTGFAFGLERVIDMLDELNLYPLRADIKSRFYFSETKKDIFISENHVKTYLNIVDDLEKNKVQEPVNIYIGSYDSK